MHRVHHCGARLLLLLLLTVPILTSAQDKGKKTKVVLYKESKAVAFDTVDCVKNVFKLNPLLFLQGEIPLYYERAVTERVSIEVAAGITLRNYVSLNFGNEADDFGGGTEVVPRLAAHVALRYYLTDDIEPHGWYIGPEFAHRTYTKFIRTKDQDGGFSDEELKDERIFNDLKLIAGYQMLSATSNWLVDIYGGFGIRDRHLEKVKEQLVFSTNARTYSIETVDGIVPAFFLGFKLGLGF